eukprot:TRINITY_DN34202_c0_g1_i1.p1 TRINITY_DN34202_c0_g1~~TRINITY_DN34202_c0_g1_i1.p1  ORF type:complete len:426 (+),score=27.84 TRINITY_DN34202_c0_g1_i1:206-1483(+)
MLLNPATRTSVGELDPFLAFLLGPEVPLLAKLASRLDLDSPHSESTALGIREAVGSTAFLLTLELPRFAPGVPGSQGFCPWQLLLGSSHEGQGLYRSGLMYFLGHFHEFYGNAGAIQMFFARLFPLLPYLLKRHQPPLVVQVGAGICEEEHDNLVVAMLNSAGGCSALDIIAVDATARHLERLKEDTRQELGLTPCVDFVHAAVSDFAGVANLYGNGPVRSLQPTSLNMEADFFEPVTIGNVPVQSLQGLLENRLGIRSRSDSEGNNSLAHFKVAVLVIDTEGHEWRVIKGLLDAHGRLAIRPTVIVVEYGLLWSATTRAAQRAHSQLVNATAASVEDMKWPSLFGMVRWFADEGYSAFLLGRKWLIPISGDYWHDAFEVCRAPRAPIYRGLHGLYNAWCWLDVVFILQESSAHSALWSQFVLPS